MQRTFNLVVAPLADDPTLNNLETGLDMSQLDVEFHVKKTLKPKPNTCKVRVWGLAATSRRYLHTTKKSLVRLEAGYDGNNHLLFLGQARGAFSTRDGVEVVTHIETGDSEKDMAASGIVMTFGDGATLKDAYNAISNAFSEAQTKITSNPDLPNFVPNKSYHPKRVAIDRQTTRYLNDMARSAGMFWNINNGNLYMGMKDQTEIPSGKALLVSPDTGLIGSPSVDHKGLLDVKTLILPGLKPGAIINVDAEDVKGYYRIETATYHGNTSPGAKEWYCKMTGKLIG